MVQEAMNNLWHSRNLQQVAIDITTSCSMCCESYGIHLARGVLDNLRGGSPGTWYHPCNGLREVFFVMDTRCKKLLPLDCTANSSFQPACSGSINAQMIFKWDIKRAVLKIDKEKPSGVDFINPWIGNAKPASKSFAVSGHERR